MISPVAGLIESPLGRPLAEYVNGSPEFVVPVTLQSTSSPTRLYSEY